MAEGGGKGCKKKGRWAKKLCNKNYKEGHRREKNKIKRVRQSSGYDAAVKYAHDHGITIASAKIKPPDNKVENANQQ